MKIKNIIAATLAVLLSVSYIYFVEVPRSERKQQESKPFAVVDKNELLALVLKGANSTEIRFSRSETESNAKAGAEFDSKKWGVEGKEYAGLDATSFNALINQLFTSDLGEALPKNEVDKDLNLYGLALPELSLTASYKKAADSAPLQLTTVQFDFGKKNDFISKRYLNLKRPDGSSDIFMIDDLLFFAANKAEFDYRKKEFAVFDDSKFKKILINSALFPAPLSLQKVASKIPGDSQEVWTINSPITASAENDKIIDLLRSLKNMKANRFIEGSEASQLAQTLNGSLINLEMFDSEQADPIKISITKKSAQDKETLFTYSKYRNTIFAVEEDKFFSEFEDIEPFRKHNFFKFDIFDAQAIKVEAADKVLLANAKKDADKWKVIFSEQGEKEGDPAFVEGYLSALTSVSAIAFPSAEDKDFGFDNPRLKAEIQLTKFDSTTVFTRSLLIGKEVEFDDGEKGYFAGVDDLSEPFIISEQDLLKIQPKPATWIVLAPPAPASPVATPISVGAQE
jgi:hypothetical protein